MADNVSDTVTELAAAVRSGDRSVLPRAITLVESTRADHRQQAQELLLALLPHAGGARRVGITGVPGVGKSTTIEALGMHLIEHGHRVAVLAVDPSSTRTGGSILGDKTRMQRLAAHPDAYIRPSPTSGTLGGVAKATRETVVLLEAAGFDVILIETVGVTSCKASRKACWSWPTSWWSTRPTANTSPRRGWQHGSCRPRSGSSIPVKPFGGHRS
jgi:LAO/AO transport system kinase